MAKPIDVPLDIFLFFGLVKRIYKQYFNHTQTLVTCRFGVKTRVSPVNRELRGGPDPARERGNYELD